MLQAGLGAPPGGPHGLQVLAALPRTELDLMFRRQGLGQLGRRHLAPPGVVWRRPRGAMTHTVQPLDPPRLQPQTHRLVAVLQIRRQPPQGLSLLGAQDHFHPVPFGGGQGGVLAQAAQRGVLGGGDGGKVGAGHERGFGVGCQCNAHSPI